MPSLTNLIVHIKDMITGHHIIEPFRADQFSVSIDQPFTEIFGFNETRAVPGRPTGRIDIETSIEHFEIDNFSPFWEQEISRANIQINPIGSDHNNHYYESCVLSSLNWGTTLNGMSTIEIGWIFIPQLPGEPSTNRIPSSRPRPARRLKEQKLDWHELGF